VSLLPAASAVALVLDGSSLFSSIVNSPRSQSLREGNNSGVSLTDVSAGAGVQVHGGELVLSEVGETGDAMHGTSTSSSVGSVSLVNDLQSLSKDAKSSVLLLLGSVGARVGLFKVIEELLHGGGG
jgi:hypothetical protein